jgi:uncharacterized protein DUF3592
MDQLMGTMNMVMYLSYGIAALVVVFAIFMVMRLVRGGAQNRQLLQTGESATATIVELHDTGVSVNDNPQVELVLDVVPAGRPPFRATTRTLISRLQTSQVQPGMQVLVKFDANDTSKVALAGFAGVAAR